MVDISQEQAAEMKEKLANMSPEEIKEFQKKQCIFCQIIEGKVASKKIYSDDHCSALLDINPANPGHILLLPNEHYSIMPLMPEEELGHLFMVAKALCQVSLKALEAQGTNIFVANGIAAGQKAQHFMLHVIPRKEGDNVNINIPENSIKDSDMKQIMDRLKPAVEKALGPRLKEEKLESGIPNSRNEVSRKPEKEAEKKEEKAEEKKAPKKEGEKLESEIPNSRNKVSRKPKGSGKFVTSEKARRFHSPECPFAEKIPDDKKIFISEEEVEEQKKIACGCTGLKKTMPSPKKEKKKPKEEEPEEEIEEEMEKESGEGITLDDISSMITGGR